MMGIFNFMSSEKKRGGPSLLYSLKVLLLVFLIGFFSSTTVRASSHMSFTTPPTIGASRAVDFVQVSVVRLVAAYEPPDAQPQVGKAPPILAQCTGLGVMVASWTSEDANDQNNWLLTDGSLVDSGQPACLPSSSNITTNLALAHVDLYFNTTFNPAMVPAISVPATSIDCLVLNCSGGLALLSFATTSNQTFPHVDLARTNLTQDMALALRLSDGSGLVDALPAPSNTSRSVIDQYVKEAQRFLTPQQIKPGDAKNPLEAGTPIFNNAGELTAIESSDKNALPVKDILPVINVLPKLNQQSSATVAPVHTNPVYENWQTGINDYYQGDLIAARGAFQKAASGNALFQTPILFEQLIASRLAKNGQPTSPSSINVTFFGIQFTIPNRQILVILILGFLLILLILVAALIIRSRLLFKRRMLKAYAEAERQADLEARRIVAMEEKVQRQLPQNLSPQTPLARQIAPLTKPVAASTPGANPELHCPRCSEVVPKGAVYCPRCRLQLIAPEPVRQVPTQALPPTPLLDRMPSPIPSPPAQSPTPSFSAWPVSDNSNLNVEPFRVPNDPVQESASPSTPSGATTYIGQRLGNYRIKSLLGHGGFADVYLGEHVFLKTNAAVKVLHTRLTTSDLMKSFVAEARTIVNLNHPHIIRVLEFGVEGNEPDLEQSSFNVEGTIPYLIMDYAPGGTLRGRYPKGTRVPLPQVIYYVKQVADALQYAHNRKLIHRDVKPENMLLSQHDELLLSDFGIVTVAHSEHSMSTQEMAGTIAYMAPEQIKGKPHPASDQYALAVVVYEWLSGTRPFQGTSQWEIMDQHLSIIPLPLRGRVPSLPPAVDSVVLKALAKTPPQRFVDIVAFADALEQAANLVP